MSSKRFLPDVSRRYFRSIVRRVYVVIIIMTSHVRSTLNNVFFARSSVWSSSSSIRANERLERHSRIRVVRERRADGKRRRHACARVVV